MILHLQTSQQVNEVKYGHTFNTASNKVENSESEITEGGHTGGGISGDASSVPGAGNTPFMMDKPTYIGTLTVCFNWSQHQWVTTVNLVQVFVLVKIGW